MNHTEHPGLQEGVEKAGRMTEDAFFRFLETKEIHLNAQQHAAVRQIAGPVLLLAVPGSGKTTTLIIRIGYMILCCGISPEQILTLTYTNAATDDMRRRFQQVFGECISSEVRFQTINSLCYGIIHQYARLRGSQPFRLEADNAQILSQLYRQVYDAFPTEADIGEAQRVISYIKNMRLEGDDIQALTIGDAPAQPLYDRYQAWMRSSRRMDFDDQLTISYHILCQYPQLRDQIAQRYPYILVDEAQDTSKVQHEIIARLAGEHPNLFMVGDEDQSIYGFRAAYPRALLDFTQVYHPATELFLEENYRSTPQIVDSAGKLIAWNTKRRAKQMHASRSSGSAVDFMQIRSRLGQYAYLMKCLEHVETDTAVLYRNNDSAIPLIYHLRRCGIPYRCRGMEGSFFGHRVLRDIRDFTAFARDPADSEIFLRIYYKTGLKIRREHAIQTVRQFDPDVDPGLFHTYLRIFGGRSKHRQKIQEVIDGFRALRKESAWEAISRIEYKLRKAEDRDREKFFLLRALTERGEGLDAFLAKLDGLQQVMTDQAFGKHPLLTLSTVHSSKGLEYSDVYIIDAVEGILPGGEDTDLEEERRIFYVAMTRARNRLRILCYQDVEMPFIDLLRGKQKAPKSGADGASGPTSSKHRVALGHKVSSDFRPASDFFHPGQKIRHTSMGAGRVLRLEGEKVVVRFDSGKEARLLAEYCIVNHILQAIL